MVAVAKCGQTRKSDLRERKIHEGLLRRLLAEVKAPARRTLHGILDRGSRQEKTRHGRLTQSLRTGLRLGSSHRYGNDASVFDHAGDAAQILPLPIIEDPGLPWTNY